MTPLSHTCLRLKESGFPQPQPAPGQWWFHDDGNRHLIVSVIRWSGFCRTSFVFQGIQEDGVFSPKGILEMVFCPSTEDIAAMLPPGFILEMWDGRHSCKIDNEDYIIRTQADSFSEAAALVWLELNKKQTPTPNIIGAGATSAV